MLTVFDPLLVNYFHDVCLIKKCMITFALTSYFLISIASFSPSYKYSKYWFTWNWISFDQSPWRICFRRIFYIYLFKKIFNPIIAQSWRYFLKYRACDVQLILKTRDFATRSELPRGMYNRFGKKNLKTEERNGGKEVNNQDKIKRARLTLPSVVNVVPFLFDFVIPGCSERDRDTSEKSLFHCGRFLWDAREEENTSCLLLARINDSNLIAINACLAAGNLFGQ